MPSRLNALYVSLSYVKTSSDDDLLQGTWQFMSISLLGDATKPHDIFDDLESLLWVLLFIAVHCFKYEGRFPMQIFNEAADYVNGDGGRTIIGGDAKMWWIQRTRITFECKPLQDFFESFRRFRREHLSKIADSVESEDEKKALEEYEAEIQQDIYGLVSHFDNILNDPNTDWTGQEARGNQPNEIPQAQQDQDEQVDDRTDGLEKVSPPKPQANCKTSQVEKIKRGKKRNRPPEEDDGHRRERSIVSTYDHDGGGSVDKSAPRVSQRRTRTIPVVPFHRVLRARTRN